jgi:hypothetical protein
MTNQPDDYERKSGELADLAKSERGVGECDGR